jgi:AraC-like DNA-binding protein
MAHIDILGIDSFKDGGLASGFYANWLSDHLTKSHRHINRPHKHNFYAVILFTAGSGIHEIEFESFTVEPGAIFFLTPGQTHNWKLSDDAEGFVLFHSREFYNSQYLKLTADSFVFYSHKFKLEQLILNPVDRKEVVHIFEDILKEKDNVDNKSAHMIISLITRLYILNERLLGLTVANVNISKNYNSKYSEFLELLEKNYNEEKSAQQYADWLNISSKHLNRINKTLLNKSTSDIISERIILEAKRMLIYTSLNFTQIAAELGYSDYAYFSKLFRKHVGLSPSQFVKMYSETPSV